ncbi:MAG: FAD-dependent oxidoreductase [Planctomycetes bacterium]|nr:FAD-dependent oxidoreductase [Planctomycetota bacterium]
MIGAGRHSLIIGGGVVGIGCAHFLNKAGFRVTVIDKGKIGRGCSHGNCGFVCPSHVLPLAEPGAIRSTLKAMLKPGGAFRIRPRFDLSLWRWLFKFARRCNQTDMLQSAHAIQPLLASSMQLYEDLVECDGLDCEWQKRGLLFVYQSQKAFDAYEPVNDLLTSEFNEPARRINGKELSEFEPALKDGLPGAWYFEHDAHLRPDRLLASWRSLLEKRGVRFVEDCQLLDLEAANDAVVSARTSGESIEADSFVIATGAWTPQLARILRCRIPIEPGKGYSITLPRPASCPRIPMLLPEHRVGVTPLETGMRLGSIMEFAGYDDRIRPKRLRLLTRGASHYLREPLPEQVQEKWFGWRPMTYDSTPVIGLCPAFSNVWLATGHNMLGLSMAPATGRLVCELITGVAPHVAPSPYSPNRFFG